MISDFDNKSYLPIFLSILCRPKENMVLMLVIREKSEKKEEIMRYLLRTSMSEHFTCINAKRKKNA